MPDIFDQITEPAKGGDIFDQITSVEDVGGEKLTPETEAAIKRDEEAVNLREPRTGLREGIERLRQTPLARKILGPSALEREAMVGSTGSPGEIVSTALKFATVPEPVREAIRPVVEAPIQWLPIPEPVKAALLAPQRLALETPLAPIPAGMGKPVVAAFAAQTLANLPEQKAAYDAALARGDVTEAVKIGSSVALATGLIAAGGAIEGVRPKAPIETLVDRIAETAPVTAKVIEQTIKPESEVPSASSIEKATEVYANVPAQPRPGEGQMPTEISGEGVQPLRGGQPAQGGAVRPQGEAQYPVEPRPALTPEEAAIRAEVQEAGFSTREAPQPAAAPAEIVGMGGATPAEFQPARQTATGIKNAAVDAERQARGQQPILAPERLRNPVVWDKAMAKIDTDPAWQDRLIAELQESPRTPSAEEIVALDHRYVDLQNEYAKATRDGAQHFADGYMEGIKEATERAAFYESQLGQLEQVARKVGTEWGRSGQMRQRLMREDFSLAAMEAKMRAAKGFEPLTEQEHAEIGDLATKLEKAEQAAEQSERTTPRARTGGLGPDAARKRGQVDTLKQEFEGKLERERFKRRETASKAWIAGKEILNISRNVITSWDLSAVLRQGKIIGAGHPVLLGRAVKDMFGALISEKTTAAIDAEIRSRPNAVSGVYEKAGLELTKLTGDLTRQEENFMSRLASKIPGVNVSNRAFNTFLNRLSADTFDLLYNQRANPSTLDKAFGIKAEVPSPAEAKALANYINVARGRGPLPDVAKRGSELLSMTFFSPRFNASRVQFLVGQPLWRGSMTTRYMVAKEYAKFMAGMSVIYGLGIMAGGTVETDPRSADYGKIRFGKLRWDPMAGLNQWVVLTTRLGKGEYKTSKGQIRSLRGDIPYGGLTGKDVASTFFRNKLAPIPGQGWDIFVAGQTPEREEVTPGTVAKGLLQPISFGEIAEIMEEEGVERGTVFSLLSILGDTIQVYQDKKPK